MSNVVPFERPTRPVESPSARRATMRSAVGSSAFPVVNDGIYRLLMTLRDTCQLASEAFDAALQEGVDLDTRAAIVELTHATLAVQSVFTDVVASSRQAAEGQAPVCALAAAMDYAATLDVVGPTMHECDYDLKSIASGLMQAAEQLRRGVAELQPSDTFEI